MRKRGKKYLQKVVIDINHEHGGEYIRDGNHCCQERGQGRVDILEGSCQRPINSFYILLVGQYLLAAARKNVYLYLAKAIEHPTWRYSQKLELVNHVTAKVQPCGVVS